MRKVKGKGLGIFKNEECQTILNIESWKCIGECLNFFFRQTKSHVNIIQAL